MERTLIAPGVHLSCDPASKFNRCRISIHFAFPAERKTATAHALLPLVMERGYADCPDMTQLTKKLAKLYGADLTVDARPMGCNHNLCVSVTGIKDAFALEGEALTAEYTKIALGAAFHPYLVDGCFDPQAVSIEKQMLKKGLEDEINDKRIYCLHQANREFFGDSPAGVRQEGYLEEVDGLTPAMLTAVYHQMLRTANIELLVLGCDAAQTAAIRDALLAELACIDRAPLRVELAFNAGCRVENEHFMLEGNDGGGVVVKDGTLVASKGVNGISVGPCFAEHNYTAGKEGSMGRMDGCFTAYLTAYSTFDRTISLRAVPSKYDQA